tara:strand:+ start:35 stop:895 length:861 start_codon:yes stop_codon:yes gene_type:complete
MALAANALTTVANAKTYMGITGSSQDSLIELLINNVSDQIERWCDRTFAEKTYTEFIDARGTRTLAVANPPITTVDLVAFGARHALTVSSATDTDLLATVAIEDTQARLYRIASNGTATTTTLTFSDYKTTAALATAIDGTTGYDATSVFAAPSSLLHRTGGRDVLQASAQLTLPDDAESDYRIDYDRGFIHLRADAFPRFLEPRLNNHFPNQFQSVYVQYSGGYATIPNALVQAAFELVSDALRGRDRDRNIQQESVGDYSYTVRPVAEWSAATLQLLAPFRRIR